MLIHLDIEHLSSPSQWMSLGRHHEALPSCLLEVEHNLRVYNILSSFGIVSSITHFGIEKCALHRSWYLVSRTLFTKGLY